MFLERGKCTGKMNLFDLWICLHIFDQLHHFITEKMDWTEEYDIILLREVLAQDPCSYKAGPRKRGQILQSIADVLNDMQ